MRTRFAITSMLVIGVLLTSTAGAGMALSGVSGSGSAGSAQYATPGQHGHGSHLGTTPANKPASKVDSSTASRSTSTPPVATTDAVQATNQLATPSGSSQLPFTGLALIPLIILGVAMLTVGLVLHRRANRST